ncbi:MAG: autotransporter-associated beta strand repeat-containing protein, partial [Planctomycetaceae bacterium]
MVASSGRMLLALAVLGVAAVAEAQSTTTWTGGGSTTLWSDAGNWTTPPVASGTFTLSFSGTAKTSSFNNSVTTVKSNIIGNSAAILFTNDGTAGKDVQFRLTGGPLVLYGDVRMTNPAAANAISLTDEIACDLVLTNASVSSAALMYTASFGSLTHNLLISGSISQIGSDPCNFRKGGTGGTLTLSGENVFLGQMQVFVGAVAVDRVENVGNPSPLGAGNLPIRLGNGNQSGQLIYTGTGEVTNRYFEIGAGPATAATGGATVTSNGSGPLVFDAANRSPGGPGTNPFDNGRFNTNYQGDNQVAARTLVLNGTNAGDNEIRSVIADQAYSFVTTSIQVTKAGSGRWIFSGDNLYTGTTTVSGGVLQVGNSGTTGTLGSGPVVNNATLSYKRSDDVTIATAISGSGGFVQAGTGVLTLGTSQGYTGRTSIEAGTLSLGEAGS